MSAYGKTGSERLESNRRECPDADMRVAAGVPAFCPEDWTPDASDCM
jgi:hypothetical protein